MQTYLQVALWHLGKASLDTHTSVRVSSRSLECDTRYTDQPCCRGGGRLEPVQYRLVTLATCTGGGFRGRGAGGWPCQNHPTVRPRAYVYRWSRRGALYVQRCTIEPPSSWQDARRKRRLTISCLPLSLSLSLSLLLLSSLSPYLFPPSFSPSALPVPGPLHRNFLFCLPSILLPSLSSFGPRIQTRYCSM